MSREIKFRICYRSPHTDEPNKWFVSYPLTPHDMMFSQDTQVDFLDGSYLRYNEMDDGESEIIFQQYTGLKDKNGREIYEGDIVKAQEYSYCDSPVTGYVKWGEYEDDEYVENLECWIVEGFWKQTPLSCVVRSCGVRWSRGQSVVRNSTEIIGNIFENSELLNATI